MLVISNRPRASGSSDFEITRAITPWIVPTRFNYYLTIRLWARDFYEVIVDEAEGRINYRLIEIESE